MKLSLWIGCCLAMLAGVMFRAEGGERSVPEIQRLTEDGHFKVSPRWSPNGDEVLYSQMRKNRYELMRLEPGRGGKPERFGDAEVSEYEASWSPHGKGVLMTVVKLSPGQGDLEVYCKEGESAKLVLGTEGKLSHEESAAWSPDGKRIALVSTRDGNQEIYTCAPDGSELVRLTTDPGLDKSPVWSREGKRIFFATNRWGDLELAAMKSDGTDVRRLTESKGLDDYPALSRDGERLAFVSNRDGDFEIYVLELRTGKVQNVTNSPSVENFPCWSPDGRLLFSSNRGGGGFDLYLMKVPAAE